MPGIHLHSSSSSVVAATLAAICMLGMACAGGDPGPRQGSPEWFLQAAEDNYAIPDYTKTVEQLKEAMAAEGEAGARAAVWRFVLTGGLALGYDELTDAFAKGAEASDALAEGFQPSINEYRRRTRINAIQFAEGVGPIKKLVDAGDTVALAVPLPSGNSSASPILASVESGNKVVDSQIAAMEDQTLTRGIFTVLSTLAGGREFSQLSEEAATGAISAGSDEVEFGVARILLDISVMFDRSGINDPKVRTHVLNMAQQWSAPHLESEQLADAVKEFEFDMENERRDMEGKRRIKKDD